MKYSFTINGKIIAIVVVCLLFLLSLTMMGGCLIGMKIGASATPETPATEQPPPAEGSPQP